MKANKNNVSKNTKSKSNTVLTTITTADHSIESLPFPPFLPPQATVMCMGTFPPAADKRAMQFHYPNFQNDMWRIYGLIFFNDTDYFRKGEEKSFDADKIKAFWLKKALPLVPLFGKLSAKRAMHQMRS